MRRSPGGERLRPVGLAGSLQRSGWGPSACVSGGLLRGRPHAAVRGERTIAALPLRRAIPLLVVFLSPRLAALRRPEGRQVDAVPLGRVQEHLDGAAITDA